MRLRRSPPDIRGGCVMPPTSGPVPSPAAVPDAPGLAPAVIVHESSVAELRVAALSLLDRLLVLTHRAGYGPITVVASGPLPPLKRSKAWGIPFVVVPAASTRPVTTSTLVVRSDAILDKADLRRLREAGTGSGAEALRLVEASGETLPAAWVMPGRSVDPTVWTEGRALKAEGVSLRVTDRASAHRAEAALWASLTSSSDGLVDRYFNRPVGRPLSKLLIHTPVTPNAVSLASILIGVGAGYLFMSGQWLPSLVAALVFQLSAIVDCVDGDVARAVFKETPLGKWLDLVGDQVVHAGVFAGIAWGVAQDGGVRDVALGLGLAAVLGGLIAFGVVAWGMLHPLATKASGELQRVLDAATNRDFSVLVLALAAVDQLDWFLWMAAVGSHVFWILLVVLRWRALQSGRGGS